MTTTHCTSCGAEMDSHAKFCHACKSVVNRPAYGDPQLAKIRRLADQIIDRSYKQHESVRREEKERPPADGEGGGWVRVGAKQSNQRRRGVIPRHVKTAVWRRDQGRCVECGSKEKLEYDHIIPASKGGSNTERNLQLLCEQCNREKGASI